MRCCLRTPCSKPGEAVPTSCQELVASRSKTDELGYVTECLPGSSCIVPDRCSVSCRILASSAQLESVVQRSTQPAIALDLNPACETESVLCTLCPTVCAS